MEYFFSGWYLKEWVDPELHLFRLYGKLRIACEAFLFYADTSGSWGFSGVLARTLLSDPCSGRQQAGSLR